MHKSVAIGRQRNAMIVVEARSSVERKERWGCGWSLGNAPYRHFLPTDFMYCIISRFSNFFIFIFPRS